VNRAIKSLRDADVVFHMIDATEGLAEQDKKIISHATEQGLAVVFVLNKWDLMGDDRKAFKDAERNMKVMFGQMEYAPTIPFPRSRGPGSTSFCRRRPALDS
jgi:GTP-binding protein